MQQAKEIIQIVGQFQDEFNRVSENDWTNKPNATKWSKKEILGHLIDSAMNNLRRVIVSQYKQNDKIYYLQDEWVKSQNYQQANVEELIMLWVLINKQFARAIENIPVEKLSNTCDTGRQQEEIHSVRFLIDDYIVHLKHHLDQILKIN
jgi:hypothetical protein